MHCRRRAAPLPLPLPRIFRTTALPTAAFLGLCLATGTVSAAQVDVLWWNGEDQFDRGPNVPIWPYAGGNKVALGGDTTDAALETSQLVIESYSRTWDVSNETVGTKKQADVFLTFGQKGISSYIVSLRFDSGGEDMLNVLAIREYNVAYGNRARQVDNGGPFVGVDTCEPFNSCSAAEVVGNEDLFGLTYAELVAESKVGKAGYVYNFASLVLTGGPETKGSDLYGTIRIGSVLFELHSAQGAGDVQVGFFHQPGVVDSIVDNGNDVDVTIDSGPPAVVSGDGSSFCGNSKIETEEECDDGNGVDDDYCSNAWQVVGACGDGILQAGEHCDDGNTKEHDLCSPTCGFLANSCGSARYVHRPAFRIFARGSTLAATATPSDPTPSCGMGSNGATVWFWTRLVEGRGAYIDTSGSSYDSVVSVYAGFCADLTEVACNDDGAPPPECMATALASSDPGTSYLLFTPTQTANYRVMIGSRNVGDGGELVLEIPEPAAALLGFAVVALLPQLRRR